MGSLASDEQPTKLRLAGKVALITGAGRGIGAATARKFVANGARVIVTDVRDDLGQKLVAELGGDKHARFIHLDVAIEEEIVAGVKYAIDTFGGLDIIHNNAGIVGVTGPVDDTLLDKWNKTMEILVNSVLLGIKHAAKHMKTVRKGVIINTASAAGMSAGLAPHCYTTAKHAIAGLTASAAVELRYWNIRVNAVAPGFVRTELVRECRTKLYGLKSDDGWVDATTAEFSKLPAEILHSYVLDVDEVADVAVFLACDESRGVNGQTLVIDRSLVLTPTKEGIPEFMKQNHLLCGNDL